MRVTTWTTSNSPSTIWRGTNPRRTPETRSIARWQGGDEPAQDLTGGAATDIGEGITRPRLEPGGLVDDDVGVDRRARLDQGAPEPFGLADIDETVDVSMEQQNGARGLTGLGGRVGVRYPLHHRRIDAAVRSTEVLVPDERRPVVQAIETNEGVHMVGDLGPQ